MKRVAGLLLLAGVLFSCMAVGSSPQAAPASVNICKSDPVFQHRQRRAFAPPLPLLVAVSRF